MSKTLLQLWKENPPGTRFRGKTWVDGKYIVPCEQTDYGGIRVLCHIPGKDYTIDLMSPHGDWYEVYQEPAKPKPKVKRAQYLLTKNGERPVTTGGWYTNEEEVRRCWSPNWTIVARLDEREFDE